VCAWPAANPPSPEPVNCADVKKGRTTVIRLNLQIDEVEQRVAHGVVMPTTPEPEPRKHARWAMAHGQPVGRRSPLS